MDVRQVVLVPSGTVLVLALALESKDDHRFVAIAGSSALECALIHDVLRVGGAIDDASSTSTALLSKSTALLNTSTRESE